MKKTIVRTLSTAALFSTLFAGSALADTYKVQKGDSLSKIASKYNTSVQDLKTMNGLQSDFIYENQTLKVSTDSNTQAPESATYTVVKGDALIKIANRFQVTVGELKQWNNLDSNLIYVGQVLKVSAPSQTTTTTTTTRPTAPAQTPTTPPPSSSTTTSEYTVKSGDSLSKIGVQFGMTVQQLKTLNNLTSDMIYIGQKLKVTAQTNTANPTVPTTPAPTPAPATVSEYTVKSGDTLGKISGQFNMTVKDLKTLNGLTSDMIYVGQKLKVSGNVSTTPTQQADFAETMVSVAKGLMDTPYVWGGSSLSGFDCSGFIYYVANQAGKNIGRYSAEGYYNRTYYVDQPKPGDLVFFENTYKPGISHMGVYLGDNQFIHAGEPVVTISNLSNSYWTQHFDGFKRFY
ncbi:LysM peptidoglycan-binding domain-containing protein [Neobacillus pocheonensis]|uniref:C40 family peptidase n=1 Tax=Neobacillus pocheonensis TaxID=363869 RepID=UPI003D2D62E5